MNLITEQDIDSILGTLQGAGENPFTDLLKLVKREQPGIFEYLREAEGDELNPDERTMLSNVSAIAWFVIKKSLGCGRPVGADYLDRRLQRNIDLIEDEQRDADEPDESGGSLAGILSEFNEQPLLMTFIVNLVTDRPENYEGKVREEMLPVIVMHLKTVVDALVLHDDEWGADDEDAAEYSDEVFDAARETVSEMYAEYAAGPFLAVLEDEHRAHARAIVTLFGEAMYEYFLLSPAEWSVRRAAECCTEIIPGKARDAGAGVRSIVPVLVSFLTYAVQAGGIPDAGHIAERLLELEDRIA